MRQIVQSDDLCMPCELPPFMPNTGDIKADTWPRDRNDSLFVCCLWPVPYAMYRLIRFYSEKWCWLTHSIITGSIEPQPNGSGKKARLRVWAVNASKSLPMYWMWEKWDETRPKQPLSESRKWVDNNALTLNTQQSGNITATSGYQLFVFGCLSSQQQI